MKRRTILLLAAGAIALLAASSESQASRHGRWCALMAIGWGAVETQCSFPTLEACIPYVIAGNRGHCTENPNWTGYRDRPRKRKRRY
jgi:hypothetical protein